MAWGMDSSLTSSYPFPLFIVRGDSASPKYNPYNAMKIVFSVMTTFPENIMFEMDILLPEALGSMVLPGSIAFSLPGYSTLLPVCNVENLDDPPSRKIVCKQVGKITTGTNYFVSFRITVPYDRWTSTLTGNFGKIGFFTVSDGVSRDPLPLIELTKTQSQFSTINNANWFINTPSGYDATIVSSQDASASILNPHTNNLGISPMDTSQRLIFTMNMPITDVFSGTIPVGDVTMSNDAGYLRLKYIFS
jgi:hypothetical protein